MFISITTDKYCYLIRHTEFELWSCPQFLTSPGYSGGIVLLHEESARRTLSDLLGSVA
jgi:hypothetical protein